MTTASEDTWPAVDGEATTHSDEADEPMVRVRPGEPPELALARARVLGALFDEMHGSFGRFRVIGKLGAGGMGVVYEAYDPDLARGVALKLVNVAAADRDAALAEAKALARLSHPHVVPIFDVGFADGRVYLVMELVRGETLRSWARGRPVREILAMYEQAGRALAAAHEAGLVHRDFKPDNAIVGADQRVRVVDFGLACEAEDPRAARGGTPGYIAPELVAGAPVTAAADQYSFCVALAAALRAAVDAPSRRMLAAVARGQGPAEARFASMPALLRELARDPAVRWRRAGLVVGAAALGALAFALLGRSSPACRDGAQRLAAVWPARAAALADGVSERALRGFDQRWIAEDAAACRAARDGSETAAISERRRLCLERGRDALAAVRAIAETASAVELPRAVQAMPDPEACRDRALLASEVTAPPAVLAPRVAVLRHALEAARVQLAAGRYSQAQDAARGVVAGARALAYAPLVAEALLVEGHAAMSLPSRDAAVAVLAEATTTALAARAYPLAIEAWARRAWAQGTSRRGPSTALAGWDVVEPLAARATAFARALLFNNVGSVQLAAGEVGAARASFARAWQEAQHVEGRGALELIAIRFNLAVASADPVAADALVGSAVDELSDRLGADHPDTLVLRQERAMTTIAALPRVAAELEAVCPAYAATADLARRRAACWTELGLVRWDLGSREAAREAMTRANTLDDPEVIGYVRLWQGDPVGAVQGLRAALAAVPADARWWQHVTRGRLALALGRASPDVSERRTALQLAVRELAGVVAEHRGALYARLLARARRALAE